MHRNSTISVSQSAPVIVEALSTKVAIQADERSAGNVLTDLSSVPVFSWTV